MELTFRALAAVAFALSRLTSVVCRLSLFYFVGRMESTMLAIREEKTPHWISASRWDIFLWGDARF